MDEEEDRRLANVKAVIRSILLSTQKALTIQQLRRDYQELESTDIPFLQLGYSNCHSFLSSIPDTVRLSQHYDRVNFIVTPVVSENTKHISDMVLGQKPNAKLRGPKRSAIVAPPPPPHSSSSPPLGRSTSRSNDDENRLGFSRISSEWSTPQRDRYPSTPLLPEPIPMPSQYKPTKSQNEFHPSTSSQQYEYNLFQSNPHPTVNKSTVRQLQGQSLYKSPTTPQASYSDLSLFTTPTVTSPVANFVNNFTANTGSYSYFNPQVTGNYVPAIPIYSRYNYSPGSYQNFNQFCSDFEKVSVQSTQPTNDVATTMRKEEQSRETTQHNFREFYPSGTSTNQQPTMETREQQSMNDYSQLSSSSVNNDLTTTSDIEEIPSNCKIHRKIVANIRTLLRENPDGIYCSEFTEVYYQRFKCHLDVTGYGYGSMLDLINNLAFLFGAYRSSPYSDFLLFEKNSDRIPSLKSIPKGVVPPGERDKIKVLVQHHEDGVGYQLFLQSYEELFSEELNADSFGFPSIEALLMSLDNDCLKIVFTDGNMEVHPLNSNKEPIPPAFPCDVSAIVIASLNSNLPTEAFPIGSKLPQFFYPLSATVDGSVPIRIGEVYNPWRFYFQFKGKKYSGALKCLMTEMQMFYSESYQYEYLKVQVPYKGMYVACLYGQDWHRAVITDVKENTCKIFYIDYGTIELKKQDYLFYLHKKFATFPAQALIGRLDNIRPFGSDLPGADSKWNKEASRYFLQLVTDRTVQARLLKVDKEKYMLSMCLTFNADTRMIHVEQELVGSSYASFVNTCNLNNVQCVPEASQRYVPEASQQYIPEASQRYIPEASQRYVPEASQQYIPEVSQQYLVESVIVEPTQHIVEQTTQHVPQDTEPIETDVFVRVRAMTPTYSNDELSMSDSEVTIEDIKPPSPIQQQRVILQIEVNNTNMLLVNHKCNLYVFAEDLARKLLNCANEEEFVKKLERRLTVPFETVKYQSNQQIFTQLSHFNEPWSYGKSELHLIPLSYVMAILSFLEGSNSSLKTEFRLLLKRTTAMYNPQAACWEL